MRHSNMKAQMVLGIGYRFFALASLTTLIALALTACSTHPDSVRL